MKQILLIVTMLSLAATLTSHSQEIVFSYSYDAAGNRINRDTIIIGGGSKGAFDAKDPFEKEVVSDNTFNFGIIRIYPNPTKREVDIEVPVDPESPETEIRIIVMDINGRKIFDKNKQSIRTSIDLSSQPNGIYLLNLIKGNVASQWKIIKK